MYYWRFLSALCLTLGMFYLPCSAAAALEGVVVVLSEDGGAYVQVADKLRSVLSQSGGPARLPVKVMSLKEGDSIRADPGQLLVAVGAAAMEALAQKKLPQPVLSVLVPRAAFDKTARQSGRLSDPNNFSAIYLDQPWARQFALIRHALPGRKKVGILLPPHSAELSTVLGSAARAAGLVAIIELVDGEANLLPALKRLLAESDVLLAVPDPLIFNRNTIQSILITTYRHQVPLLGFSPFYVKAGAIAAVFSAPEQIALQAGEMVQRLAADRRLPPPQPPRYFSVGTNAQVARSLGIGLDDEASLNVKLKRTSESEP